MSTTAEGPKDPAAPLSALALLEAACAIGRIGAWALELPTWQVTWTDEVYRLHDLAPGAPPDLAQAVAFYEPPAQAELTTALQACAQTGQPIDLELPLRTGSGRPVWFRVRFGAQREGGRADGRIERLIGVVVDISVRKRAEQALRESEDRYRGIFDNAADAILLISLDGYIRDANPKACATYGYALDELIGLHGSQFVHPEHAHKFADALACIQSGRPCTVESVDLRKGGEPFAIDVHISPFVYEGEAVMLCSIRDISQRLREQTLMQEALLVFKTSSQAIMTTDANGVIKTVNPAFETITGYPASEAVGQKPALLRSGHHDGAYYQAMWAALLGAGHWEGEVWNRRKNGEVYAQWQTVSSVRDRQGRIVEFVAIFNDITQRKQEQEAVWRQANFDALTGLANRNLFRDRLERALALARRNQSRVGLLFLDLDAFKSINDSLGHDEGDRLLVEVARRLQACVRERDTVARLGGDEFTIVVHDVAGVDDLHTIGEKVIGVLREPFTLAGAGHFVSGSAGLTVFPDDGQDVQTLLRNADIAMYKAKQSGRNRLRFYAAQMQVDTLARLQLEAELREAVARGGFELLYQPLVDADSGDWVGAEALLRWRHPQRGCLLPADFLGVAEESGAIHAIGEWVLREAVRDWHSWQHPGRPRLRLAVNLSGVQWRADTLPELLATTFAGGGFGPGDLVLEISEAMLVADDTAAGSPMAPLKALGLGCTLDRFGTGASSLAGLKRFGVDCIKIDRSFVHGCPQDRDNAHLVEAIVAMAHSLGLRVAACGIETQAQLDFLRDLGCDQVQGRLVGAPMPADAFADLARRHPYRGKEGSDLEAQRLLAALRQDELDVDEWLRRLFAEHSPELVGYLEVRDWIHRGIDLRGAIRAHLHCRQCLADLVIERPGGHPDRLPCDDPAQPCVLQRWVAEQRQNGDARFDGLAQALDAYHHLATGIANDFRLGYRDSARRALVSLRFRAATRDVVLALVDSFKDAGQTEAGDLLD